MVALAHSPALAGGDAALRHEANLVYAEVHGIGLLADVYMPKDSGNGLAIVEVASGAWRSDRGKIRDLEKARVFEILCDRGYTVFAIRPGSVSKFTVPEMVRHINQGISWVRGRAATDGFDPDRLGLMGASAGGHLACLTALDRPAGEPDAIAAVGVFFPPTDFLDYGGYELDPRNGDRFAQLVRRLAFPGDLKDLSDEDVKEQLKAISPARRVTAAAPPFLLIHGTADLMVPLQQSERLLSALEEQKIPAELIVKQGGGHPWPTIDEEVAVMADWFDRQLNAQR